MPFPPPGDLPDPEIEPRSPELQADSLLSEPAVMLSSRLKFNLCIQVGWFAFLKLLLGRQGSGSLGLSWFVSVAPHLEAICLKHVNILFALCFLHELKNGSEITNK